MPKIKIKVSLLHNNEKIEQETVAIIQDDIIKYKEKDGTIVIFDKIKNILKRENNQIFMEYTFDISKITKGTLHIKELNQEVLLSIETKKMTKKDNHSEIIFTVEKESFQYDLEELK